MKAITTLATYGLSDTTSEASQDALRCVANAFVLNEDTRQIFVDQRHATAAVSRIGNDNDDDRFLCSRILLLLTYNTTLDFRDLVQHHNLAANITEAIKSYDDEVKLSLTPATMALAEVLQLTFNVIHFFPTTTSDFNDMISPVIRILAKLKPRSPPLDPPVSSVINVLLNLNLASVVQTAAESVEEATELSSIAIARLTSTLDACCRHYPERELDKVAMPLLTLLRKIGEVGGEQIRSLMAAYLLPGERERDKPLGQGDSLAARLLRLSVSPMLTGLRENIANLLFELSEKDPEKFTHNVGYGYASGFLLSHNLAVPLTDAAAQTRPTRAEVEGNEINPVTGQRTTSENVAHNGLDDMTEEEKEREAERLFVLFERLKATGVVDVQNPVQRIYKGD